MSLSVLLIPFWEGGVAEIYCSGGEGTLTCSPIISALLTYQLRTSLFLRPTPLFDQLLVTPSTLQDAIGILECLHSKSIEVIPVHAGQIPHSDLCGINGIQLLLIR